MVLKHNRSALPTTSLSIRETIDSIYSRYSLPASVTLLAGDELVGSLPDAALDRSQERRPPTAIGLTILDATDAN
jgi:hypothetical protein